MDFKSIIKPDIIVTTMNSDGSINTENVQLMSDWNNGKRNVELIKNVYNDNLINILLNDLGLIRIDENGILKLKWYVTSDLNISVMRLLGKMAEAVVVKKCNEDCFQNRRWGMYARKGKKPHKSLDKFIAIGTGLLTTKNINPQKYNISDPHRDIIWLNIENTNEELSQITNSNNSAISAGLQLKVSQNGLAYLYRNEIATRKYEVPLVYFDLNNDFYTIANKIYQEKLDVQIGIDFIRGKDIDSDCHEMLLSFYPLLYEVLSGKMSIERLLDNKLFVDSLKKEILEQYGKEIITIN